MKYLTLLCLSFLLLAGCDQQKMLEKFTSPKGRAAARYYIDQLIHRNFPAIEAAADKRIMGQDFHATLGKMASLIPEGDPLSVKLVGATTNIVNTPSARYTIVNNTFEFQYPDRWIVTNVAFREQGDAQTIVGFYVTPQTQSLEVENAFTLAGKPLAMLLILASGILAAILSVYALIACAMTKLPRRKWLWILFILLGLGKLNLNWTTGHWGIQPIAFQLLSAGMFKPLYGAAIISVSFPLGAILFLMRRRRYVALAAEADAEEHR